jgi:hypothetical protein
MTETILRIWRKITPRKRPPSSQLHRLLFEGPSQEQTDFFREVSRKANEDQQAIIKKYDEIMAKQR